MARRLICIAIALATLALGCFPGEWFLEGKVDGPIAPSAADRSIVMTIKSSRSPSIRIEDPAGTHFADCRMQWTNKPFSCVLPPGAKLLGISIEGSCPTGCKSQKTCAPPRSELLEVRTEERATWKAVAVLDQAVTIAPPVAQSGGSYSNRQLEVAIDTASKSVSITAEAKVEGKPYELSSSSGWYCHHPELPYDRPSCRFDLSMTPQDPKVTPTIHLEASVYGACPSVTPCSAPSTSESAIRIVSLKVH